MMALGTLQESSAFRNLCRAYDLPINEYNEIAKNLLVEINGKEVYREEYIKNEKWGKLIEESKKFVGVIDSISPSPCSFIMLDKPISEEIGLIKIGDTICASIDGITADNWKYLKNDFLTVKVWKIISETFKLLNNPIPNIEEMRLLIDDKIWNLYENGLTATLNQVDTEISTKMMRKYKAKTVSELSAFVAAIRPRICKFN
jgi:DNA polymerase III alpha subunit